ncbi:hypothetical protein CP980_00020 [Streptomyces vinaceus]|uniref:Uncharacterized protein n=1 Tax=Streptomyces vinaceus TaxID=1960 RepID=A0A5J6IYG3_STRVI|nr:hypothetical protein CP980_00020 [Streptomyces vinaceus]
MPWRSWLIAGLVTPCEERQSSAMDTRPGTVAAPGRERWGTTGFDVPTLRSLAFGFGACCWGLGRFAFAGSRSGFRTVRIPEPDLSSFAVRGCSRRVRDADEVFSGATTTAGAGGRMSGSGVSGSAASAASRAGAGAGTENCVRSCGDLLSTGATEKHPAVARRTARSRGRVRRFT